MFTLNNSVCFYSWRFKSVFKPFTMLGVFELHFALTFKNFFRAGSKLVTSKAVLLAENVGLTLTCAIAVGGKREWVRR